MSEPIPSVLASEIEISDTEWKAVEEAAADFKACLPDSQIFSMRNFAGGWMAHRDYRPEPRGPISPEQYKVIDDFCAEVPGRTVTQLGYSISVMGRDSSVTAEGWLSDGTWFELGDDLKLMGKTVADPRHGARYTQ